MDDTYTVTIEADGEEDELELPVAAVDLLREDDESVAEVVGDLATMSITQQLHSAVHHGHGEPTQELQDGEEAALEAFEARFGRSFAEVTGHDH